MEDGWSYRELFFCPRVHEHVQSLREMLSAAPGQEGPGRPKTTYGGVMRFCVEGFSKKG